MNDSYDLSRGIQRIQTVFPSVYKSGTAQEQLKYPET